MSDALCIALSLSGIVGFLAIGAVVLYWPFTHRALKDSDKDH